MVGTNNIKLQSMVSYDLNVYEARPEMSYSQKIPPPTASHSPPTEMYSAEITSNLKIVHLWLMINNNIYVTEYYYSADIFS